MAGVRRVFVIIKSGSYVLCSGLRRVLLVY